MKLALKKLTGISEDEKVLLFFGFVRKYKGLDYLLKAMPEIKKQITDCKLLVVGDFGNDKNEYTALINTEAIGEVVNIYDGYIPDKEDENFFAAADVVVLRIFRQHRVELFR